MTTKREINRKKNKQKVLELINGLKDYQVVEDFRYENARTRIKLKHKTCGTMFEPQIRKLFEGSRCPNVKCFTKKRVEHLRKSDKFFNFLKNNGYEVVEKDFIYKSNKQRVKIKHIECGFEWSPIVSNLLREKTICPNCKNNPRKERGFNNLKKVLDLEKEYKLIEDDFIFKNIEQKIILKHTKCDTIFTPMIKNFVSGSRCPTCARNNIARKPHKPNRIFDFIKENGYELMEPEFVFKKVAQRIRIKHSKCGYVWEPVINNLFQKLTVCPRCKIGGPSQPEQDLVDYIKSLGITNIKQNDRTIISPKELDIYLPDHNFAIEYNGLYWHISDKIGKKAHLQKTLDCADKNIGLFHIFSDEWENKSDIIKSMIAHRIKKSPRRIYARNTQLKEIVPKQAREFFNKSHISGFTPSRKYFALEYNNEIVACLSLKKPIQKKWGYIVEISRFATAPYTSVIGGFSKMFKVAKKWVKEEGFEGILSYADRRFGEGETYLKMGFEFKGATSSTDYWYTDFQKREFRFKYRAQNGLTEKDYALSQGVYKIYGCGSNIYLFKM